MKKLLSIFLSILVIIGLSATFSFLMLPEGNIKKFNPHETVMGAYDLPTGFSSIFAGSGECEFCHGDPSNGGNNLANRDSLGNDISPATLWKGTMMANSSKDPFWRAKVSHEGLVNPSIKDDIENVCTKCHAPNGHFAAIHDGDDKFTISDMIADPLAMDGVSCTSCHSMTDEGFGSEFSANITYDTTHNVYGPYDNPFQNPMQNMIGFTPNKGNHITQSEQCGICHTLITHPVDSNTNSLGTMFVEQAMYHEWKNSEFSQNDETCQSCHMPRTDELVAISNRPNWLDPRTPFGKHELVGGNTFMLQLFQKYIDSLQIAADSLILQDVIERTRNLLQTKTLDLTLEELNKTSDTAFYELKIQNKAGHKFPSGYPARRAVVEFLVTNGDGTDTLFHSGKLDAEHRVVGENPVYEPHHDVIRSGDQSQIYEMVMGDVYGNTTTVLEYAHDHLKDNRLTPKGFTVGHATYDTVEIAGNAANDANFNFESGVEGSGSDRIKFNVALNGYSGDLKVLARVHYQSVPPKWLDEMFAHSSDEIDRFKMMFNSMDVVPEVVAEVANYDLTGVSEIEKAKVSIYPNPTAGFVTINAESMIEEVVIFNYNGRRVKTVKVENNNIGIDLPRASGVYFLVINQQNGESRVEKVVKY